MATSSILLVICTKDYISQLPSVKWSHLPSTQPKEGNQQVYVELSVFLPSYLPAGWNAHVMTRTLVALLDLEVKSHAKDDGVAIQKEPEALMASGQ